MKIEYIDKWEYSRVKFLSPGGQERANINLKDKIFISRDNFIAEEIEIENKSKYGKLAFCHEIAHLYLMSRINWGSLNYNSGEALRHEVETWRLTKSFCKNNIWNENIAKDCLLSFFKFYGKRLNSGRLKIIPMNKGLTLK